MDPGVRFVGDLLLRPTVARYLSAYSILQRRRAPLALGAVLQAQTTAPRACEYQ